MIFHYHKTSQEGFTKHVGIAFDGCSTPFTNSHNMTYLGAVGRYNVYRDLLVLADALIRGGNKVEGYETLKRDMEESKVRMEEYMTGSDEQ